MRPAFHYHAFGLTNERPSTLARIKQRLFLRLAVSKSLAALAVLDPHLAQCVATRVPNSRIRYLQDPTDAEPPSLSRRSARHRLELPAEKPIVLLYGSVDARKGVRELLAAHSSLAPGQRPHVVIAGRLHIAVKAAADMTIMDRFISDEEETLLFAACDVVWIGYRGHLGSSGVLWQSLAFHRPVIACREGLVGWLTRAGNLGVTVDVGNLSQVAAALREVPIFTPNRTLQPLSGRDFASDLFTLAGMT
jgi:glycosyltransferase involved in cell wall biosynthesis